MPSKPSSERPSTVADQPTHINLDLDTLEREQVRSAPKKKDPWVVKVDGKPLTFKDPMDIDAFILMTMEETPAQFFRATLDEADFEHMITVFTTPGKLPGVKLRALMEGYRRYYGIDEPGNVGASRR